MTVSFLIAALGAAALIQDPAADAAPAQPAEAQTQVETPAPIIDAGAIAEVNAYLQGLEAMQGRFLQINPDGSAFQGDIYLERPGKARFEYDDYPLLIVADGATVAQRDTALETTDRAALRATPLYYLLKRDIDLATDARVVAAGSRQGETAITLEDPEDRYDGRITLYFNGPALELREWVATDPLGRQTRFVLTEFTRSAQLDPRLFILEDEEDRRRGRR